MNPEVVAAIVASVVALVTSSFSIFAAIKSERRNAHRQLFAGKINELGVCIYSQMSCSTIYLKAKTGESEKKWRERAQEQQEKMKRLRLELRYSLWGIDDGLHEATLIASWVAHYHNHPEFAENFLKCANRLCRSLDASIRYAYEQGRSPSVWHCLRTSFCAWRMRRFRTKTKTLLGRDE